MLTLAEAQAAERAAFAAIGRLGVQEFEAVRCFIASGCEGEQPKPDQEVRRVLTDRLMAAIAAREAAARAAGGHRAAAASDARQLGEIAATGAPCGAARAAWGVAMAGAEASMLFGLLLALPDALTAHAWAHGEATARRVLGILSHAAIAAASIVRSMATMPAGAGRV